MFVMVHQGMTKLSLALHCMCTTLAPHKNKRTPMLSSSTVSCHPVRAQHSHNVSRHTVLVRGPAHPTGLRREMTTLKSGEVAYAKVELT